MNKPALLYIASYLFTILLSGCSSENTKTPVDYVNPYMGNISHLLVPTYPTVHLPNSMLRVYPERANYTSELIKGLPLQVIEEVPCSTSIHFRGMNPMPVLKSITHTTKKK